MNDLESIEERLNLLEIQILELQKSLIQLQEDLKKTDDETAKWIACEVGGVKEQIDCLRTDMQTAIVNKSARSLVHDY